jgi:outer membrane protein assembly factor BamB
MSRFMLTILLLTTMSLSTRGEDWPMFGRDHTRNAVSLEKGAPIDWQASVPADKGAPVRTVRNLKWLAKLGTQSLGGPVVANGLVWVGTNNGQPRDAAIKKDVAVLMCFRESDGKFLWQYLSSRLPGFVEDGPWHSMGTPLVEGDRLWLHTNRSEALCFDVGPLRRGEGEPKLVWKIDMRKDFGVFPHAILMAMGFTPSPAVDGDRLFIVTGNGVDESHMRVPAPHAPSLICFDKKTGKTLWLDASPGKNIMHAQRSSPLVISVGGRTQVVVGQGDGWLRAFATESGRLIWKCDLNPKGAKYELGARGRRNYVMATPVFAEGRIYLAPGQSPEHMGGDNQLYCVDPTGEGDVSAELDDRAGKGRPNPNSHVLWRFGGPAGKAEAEKLQRDILFSRTQTNCTVHDGLVYACDIEGYGYCLDAKTGRLQWWHDLQATCWATPLWADGKIYIPTEDGDMWIFAHGRDKKLLKQIEMGEAIRAMPIYANRTLYVMTERTLYAIQGTR